MLHVCFSCTCWLHPCSMILEGISKKNHRKHALCFSYSKFSQFLAKDAFSKRRKHFTKLIIHTNKQRQIIRCNKTKWVQQPKFGWFFFLNLHAACSIWRPNIFLSLTLPFGVSWIIHSTFLWTSLINRAVDLTVMLQKLEII